MPASGSYSSPPSVCKGCVLVAMIVLHSLPYIVGDKIVLEGRASRSA